MSLLNEKIEKKASTVSVQQGINSVRGVVTRSDPDNNLVDVKYVDMNGTVGNKTNVPVRIYFDDGVGSFPDVDDKVEMQETFGSLVVIAYHEREYRAHVSARKTLSMDVFSDTQEQTIGGMIF